MVQSAVISISGTQTVRGEKPETIELVSEGSYCYEPGYISFSYVETQLTGLEGVVTTFTIEDGQTVTLSRQGKVSSKMVFAVGRRDESLYDAGFGALLISVECTSLTVLLNENGGLFDLEYSISVEHTDCGVNAYHISIRTL